METAEKRKKFFFRPMASERCALTRYPQNEPAMTTKTFTPVPITESPRTVFK